MLKIVKLNHQLLETEVAKDYLAEVLSQQSHESNHALNINRMIELDKGELNQFYFLVNGTEIIGCCGLVLHDFVLQQDLYPWVTALHIKEAYRGRHYGQLLMTHVRQQADILGYSSTYLTSGYTDYEPQSNWIKIHKHSNRGTVDIYRQNLEFAR